MDTGGCGQQRARLQQQSASDLLESPELLILDPSARVYRLLLIVRDSFLTPLFFPSRTLPYPAFFPGLSFFAAQSAQETPCGVGLLCGCICLNKQTVNEGGRSGL